MIMRRLYEESYTKHLNHFCSFFAICNFKWWFATMQLATYFNQKIMTYTNFQRKMPILHVMVNNQVFDAINIKRHHLIELSMNFNWIFVSSLYIKKEQ